MLLLVMVGGWRVSCIRKGVSERASPLKRQDISHYLDT